MDNDLQDIALQIENFKSFILQLIQAQGFEFKRKKTPDGSITVEVFPRFITPKLDSIPRMLRAVKILRLDTSPLINKIAASMAEAISNAIEKRIYRNEIIAKVETFNNEIEKIFKELLSRRKDSKVNEKDVKKYILKDKKDTKLEKIVKDMVANLEALEDIKEYKKKCKEYDLGSKIAFDNLLPDYATFSYVLTPEEVKIAFDNLLPDYATLSYVLTPEEVKPEDLSNSKYRSPTFKDPKNR
jgi:hypothetical protein